MYISGLEFAYTQAPTFMQGLIMGLFLMTSGLGSYVATAIVAIVKAASDGGEFNSPFQNINTSLSLYNSVARMKAKRQNFCDLSSCAVSKQKY